MSLVCIVIGIVFFICVLTGWAQGLFKVIISVAGLVISIIVANYVSPYVSGFLEEHTQIDDKIAVYISEELQFSELGEEATRGIQVAVINELPLPETLKSNILDNNNSDMYQALKVTGVYEYIAKSVAVVILNAAVFLFLVLFCRLFFYFLGKSVGSLTKLPIVRSIDKVGGGMLGAMKGLMLIWIFFLLLSITSPFAWSREVITQISQSPILKLLYDNNVLLDIVGDLTRVLFL
ncbi:MAG: CvpA family protein [Lachnospiraceae bacterium]|nr:CvpA family protein [Lachnospiraceae bacterium]